MLFGCDLLLFRIQTLTRFHQCMMSECFGFCACHTITYVIGMCWLLPPLQISRYSICMFDPWGITLMLMLSLYFYVQIVVHACLWPGRKGEAATSLLGDMPRVSCLLKPFHSFRYLPKYSVFLIFFFFNNPLSELKSPGNTVEATLKCANICGNFSA